MNKTGVFTEIGEAISELVNLVSSMDENSVNAVPYKDSWTAGQLSRHITKSINGMAKAMLMESKPPGRDPGEKIPGLKKAFLDFTSKMKSPDFIIPEDGPYEKQAVIEELNSSFEHLKTNTNAANLEDLAEGLPMGPVTKWEMLHFVLYHTQRHLHQMKKINDALKS
ncbi:MAG: DinB family protein [Ferruginibacter sp.]|nr:DinB family protein [Chitinophagaceae bacterium]